MPKIDIDALRAKPKPKPSELDKASWHISQALEDLRSLPVQDLEREKFYGLIYNLLYQANWLIADDAHKHQPGGGWDISTHPSPLGDDLKDILGG